MHLDSSAANQALPANVQAVKVSELNAVIKHLLESQVGLLWVVGEISNFRSYASGHYYFTLKDPYSQIKAVMFKHVASQLSVIPKEGQEVLVKANVSVYEPRGEYQLVVQQLVLQGTGVLFQRFLELKSKLQQLGWFDTKLKKPLPSLPKTIGVVTSPSGAAVRDVIKVLKRRAPWIKIIIYPTLVQGALAAPKIAKMIELANQRQEVEALIVGRGGGSLEDLWPFNEEVVAAAIFNSKIPIISAVGHEVDFSISDFVADLRAPTPSAAAEMVSSCDKTFLKQRWHHYLFGITQLIVRKMQQAQSNFKLVVTRLERFLEYYQRIKLRLEATIKSLDSALLNQLTAKEQRLDYLVGKLDALSPISVLSRGFTLVEQQDRVVTSKASFKMQQVATLTWLDGSIEVQAKSYKTQS